MLKIGWIDFLNTMPFNFEKAGFKLSFDYELVKGVPSSLNKLLREGKIDIGIISSAEYLENYNNYLILPDVSISAQGKVFSVSIFSNMKLEETEEIYLTKASKSSRYLTKIVFEKFLNKKVIYKELENIENENPVLLIGDNAILYRDKFKYAYDLSEIWYEYTKLPFVFALWVVRKEVFNERIEEVKELLNTLKKAKAQILSNLDLFLKDVNIGKDFAKFYLSNIDYSLSEKHIKGLEKLSKYLLEMEYLKEKPVINFVSL